MFPYEYADDKQIKIAVFDRFAFQRFSKCCQQNLHLYRNALKVVRLAAELLKILFSAFRQASGVLKIFLSIFVNMAATPKSVISVHNFIEEKTIF